MTDVRAFSFRLPSSSPTTLAAIRIVIAAQALWILLSRDPAGVSAMPSIVWEGVPQDWRLRFLLVPGFPAVESFLWACAVASITCVLLGFRTRVFGIVAAVLLYHIAPLQALLAVAGPWGKGLTVATLCLPILACAPCDDRWSIAGLRRDPPIRDPDAYAWAVMIVRLAFAQIYLFSALGRLLAGGLSWAGIESVRHHIMIFRLAEPTLDTPFNAWIVAHPLLCAFLAGGVLAFELLFIVAVFVRRVRGPLALLGVFFHVGLWTTLGFRFLNLPHFLLFVDFDRNTRRDLPTRTESRADAR